MKIFACCNWNLKFLGPVLDYWRKQGHEVHYELGYSAERHEWSDVCFIDVSDNNAAVGSRQKFPSSRMVIRVIDIEAWCGQPGGVTWDNVDAVIFGAKHIRDLVKSYLTFPSTVEVHHVPFGIDTSKWTFRERNGTGKNVALVAHRWSAKNVPMLFQVMAKLGDGWKLHLLGTRNNEKWLHSYLDYIIEELGLDVTETTSVPDVNVWLEDMDYHILPSNKEAFSYATAESAAKGIKALTHNFYRATDIWPREWIWNTIDECAIKVQNGIYDSKSYRTFIENNYSLERMMEGINKACRIS